MIRIQIEQIPLLVAIGVYVLAVLRWVSLHIGLRAALRATPPADRWRLFREFTRAHRAGLAAIVLMVKFYRSLEGRAPVWEHRDRTDSR
jgi:ABC-type microcin C transport system permease subunit YejB